MQPEEHSLESDPRFPSGPWVGYFLQRFPPLGRQTMELRLTFCGGKLTGSGRDLLGPFAVKGRYDLASGRCSWVKRYLGRHAVLYRGYNEGKGIWGVWEIPGSASAPLLRGGFHIWPEGMPDPSRPQLHEEADLPLEVEEVEALPAVVGAARTGQ